jgi:hypothetical protein
MDIWDSRLKGTAQGAGKVLPPALERRGERGVRARPRSRRPAGSAMRLWLRIPRAELKPFSSSRGSAAGRRCGAACGANATDSGRRTVCAQTPQVRASSK